MISTPRAEHMAPSDRIRPRFDPRVASRGELYAVRGVVTIRYGDANCVVATVQGTHPYEVAIRHARRDRGGVIACSCTCTHARSTRRLCKHVWAALRVGERRGHLASAARDRGVLEVRVETKDSGVLATPESEPRWLIDLPASTPYSGLVIDAYTSTFERDRPWTTFRRERRTEGEADEPTPIRIAALARSGSAEVLHRHDRPPERLAFDDGKPFRLVLVVREGDRSSTAMGPLLVSGELRRGDEAVPLDEMSALYHDGVAFVGPRALRVERDAPLRWVTALQKRGNELVIEPEEAPRFLRDLVTRSRPELLVLPASFEVARGAAFRTRVHVRRPDVDGATPARSVHADVLFAYDGGAVASWRDRGSLVIDVSARRICARNRDAEQAAIARLVSAGFSTSRSALKIAPARLTSAILALPPDEFVVEADGVLHRAATRSSLSVSSEIDWFDLRADVRFGDLYAPAPALLEAAKRGAKLVRLGDGSVGVLPEEWLARVGRVMDLSSHDDAREVADGEAIRLRFKPAQLALVDAMLGDEGQAIAWHGPIAALRGHLGRGLDLPLADAPPGFRGELRDYQRAGLAWMQWLERLGLSGCLADDMGLGKTVQVLALLLARKGQPRDDTTSLVVAPRSVVYNWIVEAHKFAPELLVRELTSATTKDDALSADLVVTTYGIVRRRFRELARLPFDYVVLDEGHAIKNARASITQAVLHLQCRHRLALTGTPVENHLGELTTLFDFLNPGMFGPRVRRMARGSFEITPDDGARLGRGLRPFVLRRKKSDVLTELPPRVDQTILCEMSGAQRSVYDRVKKHYQAILRSEIDVDGLDACRFHVLEALLRLRQIACHPGLVDPELATQRSAKLDVLGELLEPIVAARKKAIVFSQFTRLLDIVGADLDAQGVRYARLDGRSSDRQGLVERFQHDPECTVFLVSLKAGGVGLNLTAAEYVFILDPWWNPAAEAQAIDRAHRMGQTKHVVAYRLLCSDTIEERVAELQEKKRALVASVFGETEAPRLGTLSVADVEALLS